MATKKRTASNDQLVPDVRYNSLLASKFINCLMYDGKKATATRVFYDAMDQIKKRMPDVNPVEVFTAAIENIKPSLEGRSRPARTASSRWRSGGSWPPSAARPAARPTSASPTNSWPPPAARARR